MPDKKLIDNLSNNSPILSNSLSDSEIKKALECCNTKLEDYQCPHCPLLHKGCKKALIQNALDLINRQKAEIERLRNHIQEGIDLAKQIPEMMELVKSEAYKEFAERVKDKFFKIRYCESYYCVVDIDDIDNLLKELVGEDDESAD